LFLLLLIPALCSAVLLSDESVYLCSRLPVLSRPGISTKARQRNKLSSSNCSVNLLVIVIMASISRECRAACALSRDFLFTRVINVIVVTARRDGAKLTLELRRDVKHPRSGSLLFQRAIVLNPTECSRFYRGGFTSALAVTLAD